MSIEKLPEINILLIGATGAGKSTTLNAIANYLHFENYEQAASSLDKINVAVSSKIIFPNPKTGENNEIQCLANIGNDSRINERLVSGDSSTIKTVGYTFRFSNCFLRIIDTPGIGDTGGAEQDKENFENIMNYLQLRHQLHGVVIVAKGNETRNTTQLKYCITELLTHLHQSVSKNIVFLFTYSRDSYYGAGEGYNNLKKFLEDKNESDVEMRLAVGENSFFIDNEAFRFLLIKKEGIEIPSFLEESTKQSWKHSAEQIALMMEKFFKVEPHDLQETISLHSARKIIIQLAQPMVQIQRNIKVNIIKIEVHKQRVYDCFDSILELGKSLILEVDELKIKKLDYSTTVCASKKCSKISKDKDGVETVIYPQRCHEKCNCFFVSPNVKNNSTLKLCEAMEYKKAKEDWDWKDVVLFRVLNINCSKCGCNWTEHMHINSTYETEKKVLFNFKGMEGVLGNAIMIQCIDELKNEAEQYIAEMEEELKVIEDCNAKFAYVLSNSAYMTHNKYYEQYLDFLIDEEYKKSEPKPEILKKIKSDYQQNVKTLNEAIKNQVQFPITVDEIALLKDRLLQLKHNGKQFQEILKENDSILEKHGHDLDSDLTGISPNSMFSKLAEYHSYYLPHF